MAYLHLVSATRRKVIDDLREYFSRDPNLNKIEVQDKFAFDGERPQFAVIVQNSTVGKVQLSSSNFMGNHVTYLRLAKVKDKRGQAIEWVKEDTRVIEQNGNVMPTPAGFYYVEIVDQTHFMVDVLYDVGSEPLVVDSSGGEDRFTLAHFPIFPGSLEVSLEGVLFPLCEIKDYVVNPTTGEVVLVQPLGHGETIYARYRYPGQSIGPIEFKCGMANYSALPGVVMAFGDKVEVGDRQVVIVGEKRESVAEVFGGRWDISFSVDCLARDPIQRDIIADELVQAMWVEYKPLYEANGIILTDIGVSGQSEDSYDENTQDYYFKTSVEFTLQTEWELAVPSVYEIRYLSLVEDVNTEGDPVDLGHLCMLSDEQLKLLESSIKVIGPDTLPGLWNIYMGIDPAMRDLRRALSGFSPVDLKVAPYLVGKAGDFLRVI